MRIIAFFFFLLFASICSAQNNEDAMKKLQQAAEYSLRTSFIATIPFPGNAIDLGNEARYFRRVEEDGKESVRVEIPLAKTSKEHLVYIWGKFGKFAINSERTIKLTGQMDKNAAIPNWLNSYYIPFMEASSYDFIFGRRSVRYNGVECYEIRMKSRKDNGPGSLNMLSFIIEKSKPFIHAAIGYDRNGIEFKPEEFYQLRLANVQLDKKLEDNLFLPTPDTKVVKVSKEKEYNTALQKKSNRSSKSRSKPIMVSFREKMNNIFWNNTNSLSIILAVIGIGAVIVVVYVKVKEKKK